MFITTKVTKFNLDSVPEIFKKGWQAQMLNRYNDLAKIQSYCKDYVRWLRHIFLLIGLMVIVSFILIGPILDHPLFSKAWFMIVLPIAISVAFLFWLSNLLLLTPPRFELMRNFINQYGELMNLLNYEWKYGFEYPTGGPGVRPTYENVEPFVREKLVKLASQIKRLEDPKMDWGECLGGSPDSKELRAEFARKFDTLKPFGLVYPGYEPYFDPDGAYFYS